MATAYGNVGTYATPPIPICPQEPWEAQEFAHRDRSRVKLSRLCLTCWSCNANPRLK